jgi:hypothetical protein
LGGSAETDDQRPVAGIRAGKQPELCPQPGLPERRQQQHTLAVDALQPADLDQAGQ